MSAHLSKVHDYLDDDHADEVILDILDIISQILASTTVHRNFTSSKRSRHDENNQTIIDPWTQLSFSLDELNGLLSNLLLKQTPAGFTQESHEDDEDAVAEVDELLLSIEAAAQALRTNMDSIGRKIEADTAANLEQCLLERDCKQSSVAKNLIFFVKSIEGAIRQQKPFTLQSILTIKECLTQIHNRTKLESIRLQLQKESWNIKHRHGYLWREIMKNFKLLTNAYAEDDSVESMIDTHQFENAACVIEPLKQTQSQLAILTTSSDLSILESIEAILKQIVSRTHSSDHCCSVLVVGSLGSGKTFLLNEVCVKAIDSGFEVVRPSIPIDTIGTTVGAAEDILISMICYVRTCNKPCLLVLDDLDILIGKPGNSESSFGGQESHLTCRIRSLFFASLDTISNIECNNPLVLICSSSENLGKGTGRFGHIFSLKPPNNNERRSIILKCLNKEILELSETSTSLSNVIESTSGMSRSELVQLCRQAIQIQESLRTTNQATTNILDILKQKLQSFTPESLQAGANDEFVDMRVFTARDLQNFYPIHNPENPVKDLPLFGESAGAAWRELHRLIVLPVCQGDLLNKLMSYRGNSSGRKIFVDGVLMAGAPGTGKSTLAYFCAALASTINSSIKLIDVSCTSLIHKEVGSSERALHHLFETARSATPCIVVMDGIENIAAVRGNDNTTEGTMDRVLSTLLTELDGIQSEHVSGFKKSGSMAIIGITHNHNWIDPALRRPGRLGKTIWIGNPNFEARKNIILRELRGLSFALESEDSDLQTMEDLAEQVSSDTDGFTGARMVAVCNEAKLLAAKSLFKQQNVVKEPVIMPRLIFQALRLVGQG